ncbi:MAG: hypothetical protein IT428_12120 [Planctomycetaceae bacterium]|nr:hypothetical protein [Planctomycetaceae bacterium]
MNPDLAAQIADQLTSQYGATVRSSVEASVRETILSFKASEVLTFVTPDGRTFSPAATTSYLKALWCFARGNPYEGVELDSIITQPIVQSTERVLVEALNSPDVRQIIAQTIAPGPQVNEELQSTLGSESAWITREVLSTAGVSPLGAASDQIASQASALAHDLMHSAAGKTVIAGVAKAAATTQGKVLLAKLVTMAAGKIAASTAMKVLIVSSLKKVGIALLIKTVLIKVLATVAPALVAAKIPVFWIILPILGGFIYYEMAHIPQKLADKVPGEIGDAISRAFPEIARKFAQMILAEAEAEFTRRVIQG